MKLRYKVLPEQILKQRTIKMTTNKSIIYAARLTRKIIWTIMDKYTSF